MTEGGKGHGWLAWRVIGFGHGRRLTCCRRRNSCWNRTKFASARRCMRDNWFKRIAAIRLGGDGMVILPGVGVEGHR